MALTPFAGLERGEADQLFVDPRHGGEGVAPALPRAVEDAAVNEGVVRLVTHASWRTAPVFERHGYQPVEVEAVRLDSQTLTRVRMIKELQAACRCSSARTG